MDTIESSHATAPSPLLSEQAGAVVTLTLNRPERLNAVSLPMYDALARELERIAADATVRAVILTGAGRAFCVGADLHAHGAAEPSAELRHHYIAAAQRANRRLQRLPKPVVAAVNGHAIGAGLELALSCDLIVVAEQARLRFPEVGLGTFVGGGVTRTLPARVGLARAKELLLLGDFFTARDALEQGMVNRVVPAGRVAEEARSLGERLALQAPLPLARAKRLLNGAADRAARRALRLEARALLDCMATEDWREGVRAFHEKREPVYHGR